MAAPQILNDAGRAFNDVAGISFTFRTGSMEAGGVGQSLLSPTAGALRRITQSSGDLLGDADRMAEATTHGVYPVPCIQISVGPLGYRDLLNDFMDRMAAGGPFSSAAALAALEVIEVSNEPKDAQTPERYFDCLVMASLVCRGRGKKVVAGATTTAAFNPNIPGLPAQPGGPDGTYAVAAGLSLPRKTTALNGQQPTNSAALLVNSVAGFTADGGWIQVDGDWVYYQSCTASPSPRFIGCTPYAAARSAADGSFVTQQGWRGAHWALLDGLALHLYAQGVHNDADPGDSQTTMGQLRNQRAVIPGHIPIYVTENGWANNCNTPFLGGGRLTENEVRLRAKGMHGRIVAEAGDLNVRLWSWYAQSDYGSLTQPGSGDDWIRACGMEGVANVTHTGHKLVWYAFHGGTLPAPYDYGRPADNSPASVEGDVEDGFPLEEDITVPRSGSLRWDSGDPISSGSVRCSTSLLSKIKLATPNTVETEDIVAQGIQCWFGGAFWLRHADNHQLTTLIRFSDNAGSASALEVAVDGSATGSDNPNYPELIVVLRDFNGTSGQPNWRFSGGAMPMDGWVYIELGFLCHSDPAIAWVELRMNDDLVGARHTGGNFRTIKLPTHSYRRIEAGLVNYIPVPSTPSKAFAWGDHIYADNTRRGSGAPI